MKKKKIYEVKYRNASTCFFEFFKNIEANNLEEVIEIINRDYGHIGDLEIGLENNMKAIIKYEETEIKNESFSIEKEKLNVEM
jgi:hypothetical protein